MTNVLVRLQPFLLWFYFDACSKFHVWHVLSSPRKSVSATGQKSRNSHLFVNLSQCIVWVLLLLLSSLFSSSHHSHISTLDWFLDRVRNITGLSCVACIKQQHAVLLCETARKVLSCCFLMLQDSEENKEDYLSRTLRVTYRNVGTLYTLSEEVTGSFFRNMRLYEIIIWHVVSCHKDSDIWSPGLNCATWIDVIVVLDTMNRAAAKTNRFEISSFVTNCFSV